MHDHTSTYSIAKAIFRNQNYNTWQLRYFDNNLSRTSKQAEIYFKNCIQLFRERLSGKVHATILKGIVDSFEFSFFQRNLKELARKALEMCLRVLKYSRSLSVVQTATVARNSVLIISHFTFRDCRVHIFSDNLSRNSCIDKVIRTVY